MKEEDFHSDLPTQWSDESSPAVPGEDVTLEELLRRVSGVTEPIGSGLLVWRRAGMVKREFELLSGDQVVGEMYRSQEKRVTAHAECFGQAFDIQSKNSGWGGGTARIREGGRFAAKFKSGRSSYSRGWLHLPDRASLRWKSRWLTTSKRMFVDPTFDEPVVLFRKVHFQGRLTVEVEVAPAGLGRPDLPLLVVAGFFFAAQAETHGYTFKMK